MSMNNLKRENIPTRMYSKNTSVRPIHAVFEILNPTRAYPKSQVSIQKSQ